MLPEMHKHEDQPECVIGSATSHVQDRCLDGIEHRASWVRPRWTDVSPRHDSDVSNAMNTFGHLFKEGLTRRIVVDSW
jgi:hypothetical protein